MEKIKVKLYGSPTCMSCKMLTKKLESMEDIDFEHLEAVEHPELNIKGVPYLIISKGDNKVYEGHPASPSEALNIIKENK